MKRRVRKKYENALKKDCTYTSKRAKTLLNFAINEGTYGITRSIKMRLALAAGKKISILPFIGVYGGQVYIKLSLSYGGEIYMPPYWKRIKRTKSRFYIYEDDSMDVIYDMVNGIEYTIIDDYIGISSMKGQHVISGSEPCPKLDHDFFANYDIQHDLDHWPFFKYKEFSKRAILVPHSIYIPPCEWSNFAEFIQGLFNKTPVIMEEE